MAARCVCLRRDGPSTLRFDSRPYPFHFWFFSFVFFYFMGNQEACCSEKKVWLTFLDVIAIMGPNSNYIPENQHQSVAVWREDFPQRDGMQTGRTPAPAPSDRCIHMTINCEGGNCSLQFTKLSKQWLKTGRCDSQRTCGHMCCVTKHFTRLRDECGL